MSRQWIQLTDDEVKNHPLNEKSGLRSFIKFLCFLSILGLGHASSQVSELYRSLDDVSQLPSQGDAVFVAIIPSLAFAIIFGYLTKSKSKNTLKIVIGLLWTIPIISFIHSFLFLSYLGFKTIPNEVVTGLVGGFIWAFIFTIGLILYSYRSQVYNLQYLHRVRNVEQDEV